MESGRDLIFVLEISSSFRLVRFPISDGKDDIAVLARLSVFNIVRLHIESGIDFIFVFETSKNSRFERFPIASGMISSLLYGMLIFRNVEIVNISSGKDANSPLCATKLLSFLK